MMPAFANVAIPLGLVAIGAAIGAAGFYVGETDDAPGAALIGLLVMIGLVTLAVRIALRSRNARLRDKQP